MNNLILNPMLIATLFIVSFLICGGVVLAHPHLSKYLRTRDDLCSIQCAHLHSTPRIGGVAVFVATVVALLYMVPDHKQAFFAVFSITLIPVFFTGLAEDLGWRVSALGRLLAAAASAGMVIALLQIWLPTADVPGVDFLLGYAPVAIAITLLWATGICHAMNLIDGVNGLAGATGVLIATGIALVAQQAGALGFSTVAAALVPTLIGFLVFNWPLGRLFMGDAGAYTLGHVLVWLSIGLAWHNTQVSLLAISLMFFWPVADTLLAIYRRLRAGRPVGSPDRLHFHQLVMRALLLLTNGRVSKGAANSATAIVLLPLLAAPIATAIYLWDRPMAALAAWGVFGVLFTASYVTGVRSFRGSRWRRVSRRVNSRLAMPEAKPDIGQLHNDAK